MSLVKIGIGVSQKDNLIEAGRRAAQKAKEELGDKKPKLLLFFCTYTYPESQYQRSQEEIYDVFGDKSIPLVGGSTLGFFAKDKYFFDISLFGKTMGFFLKMIGKVFKPLKFTGACVIALQSDFLEIRTGLGKDAFKNPSLAGKNVIKEALGDLKYDPQITNGFLITPGCNKKGRFFDSEILEGMLFALKSHFKIYGGGLCGGVSENTVFTGPVFYNGGVYEESVALVLLDSKLEIGYGTGSSVEIIDKVGLINKVKDKWTIEEINGKPAAEALFEVMGKYTKIKKEDFFRIPTMAGLEGLALVSPDLREDFFWPTFPVGIIDGKYVEVMNPEIKKGMPIFLAKGTKESCIEATVSATRLMAEEIGSKDLGFIMFFSCAIRGVIMRRDYFNEVKQIRNLLKDKDVPIFGICSNGEQAFCKTGLPVATSFIITMMGISNKIKS